jgi:hypothetical protein
MTFCCSLSSVEALLVRTTVCISDLSPTQAGSPPREYLPFNTNRYQRPKLRSLRWIYYCTISPISLIRFLNKVTTDDATSG